MEKRSKKSSRKDSASITKIYEIIKNKKFMQDLWLDVMSDMKQKPSYMRLKEMVESVIESAVDNYATKPKDHEERLKTRTIFTDLSIMTYTIDTLISELLRKKLKDEFKTIISNIVDELKNKPESSHASKNNNPVHILEGIGEMLCNGVDKESINQTESVSAEDINGHNSNYDTVDLTCIKTESSSPRADEHSVDFPDSATIAFSIVETESMGNTNNASKNVTTNLMSCMSLSKKGSPKKVRIKKKKIKKRSSKRRGTLSSDEDAEIDVVNVSEEDIMSEDSNFSFRSVSSVHTSDLSSFEDTISISSEDEQGDKIKRHIPFKDAYELFANGGKIEDLLEKNRNKNNVTYSPTLSIPVNSYNESPKRLPTRIRKPNSKYSSDDVICGIKHLNSSTDSPPSNSFQSDKSDIKKNIAVSHSDSTKRRGRPPRNKNTETKEKKVSEKLSNNDKKIHEDVTLPFTHTSTYNTEITRKRGRPPKNIHQVSTNGGNKSSSSSSEDEYPKKSFNQSISSNTEAIRKRGRPPKNTQQVSTNEGNKHFNAASSSSEDDHPKKSFNHSTSPNAKKETSNTNEPEVKRRRGRPPTNPSKSPLNSESFKHTVESFTSLEERLSVKEQAPLSPSKSSKKSYATSDLYKPRSDFRGCFDTKGNSRAITLFSN